ncbi:uncharacterized protein LOC113378280 [Ctenocephalides felis]|uniref:uncharacterized protein LOC113377328 n=1 Tax=Ctenocephalides felis TaxID=7515 RepID=UPI000E6E2969|nr:uncharacterized protein LOC113377328 [Ctenocephalides felis]XP_026474591.1 uncharacterized protein LOC113378280 [Ctenocephalides felis]
MSNKVLYATSVACLGFVCFAVGSTAVGLPLWGYYRSISGHGEENGYFGPWNVCKRLLYNREKCGPEVSKFHPSVAVWIAGLVAATSVVLLGVFSILSVLQIAQITSKDKIVCQYYVLVVLKLAIVLLSNLLTIVAACLFALQTDDRDNNGFEVTRGESFYIQIVLIVLTFVLLILAIYDVLFSRRKGGDPTSGPDLSGDNSTTFNNPGFRDQRHRPGVSMTDASGKPYHPRDNNGSLVSMNTTTTAASSNGSMLESSITRSPLRSSLKKPRASNNNGLGIPNPGFSGSGQSPVMGRNGSVKKVRIQTHSTEV